MLVMHTFKTKAIPQILKTNLPMPSSFEVGSTNASSVIAHTASSNFTSLTTRYTWIICHFSNSEFWLERWYLVFYVILIMYLCFTRRKGMEEDVFGVLLSLITGSPSTYLFRVHAPLFVFLLSPKAVHTSSCQRRIVAIPIFGAFKSEPSHSVSISASSDCIYLCNAYIYTEGF